MPKFEELETVELTIVGIYEIFLGKKVTVELTS